MQVWLLWPAWCEDWLCIWAKLDAAKKWADCDVVTYISV